MTKQALAKLIFEVVENGNFEGKSNIEMQKEIESLLSTLRPVHYEQFSEWGTPEQQSLISKCWI